MMRHQGHRTLTKKLGESLVRAKIADIQDRLDVLNREKDSYRLPERIFQYRLRWLRKDFTRLEGIARRYGFPV